MDEITYWPATSWQEQFGLSNFRRLRLWKHICAVLPR
jgi:hypothetical protein